jgi:hypothetical protein
MNLLGPINLKTMNVTISSDKRLNSKTINEFCRNNIYFNQAKKFREIIMNFFIITWPKIADAMRKRINDKIQTIKSTI